ncbi:cytochrome P450 78A9 [Ricinus communis]|uniref:Cytochrome P450, putative n=1 Tax=Ricinus communis TaxID=3988 RepID=B9RYU2_RICCO|nr:cytochrome P450 78A9 [Ricinus communis]EEF43444.1 cytochrome P450, putative [Ricinus communis]|eukprot:XP_002518911.1 cytochrome P450 78A9 [Ricinus communis]
MGTQIDSLWVIALFSKCRAISSQNTAFLLFFLCMASLAMALCYWAHPGGHAWGKYFFKRGCKSKSIPGPRGIPILGSMSLMTNLAHHKIAAMANLFKAKRLMAFSLGETRVIVTCNPDVAKEILNSSVFADRPVKESAYGLMFNRAIGFAPYGVYWRTLRRIAATHLFCPKQISSTEAQRSDIGSQMVSRIACHKGELRVRDILKRASLNNMMCSVFGRRYELSSSNNETEELRGLVEEGYELLGKLNWSDHLPWIANLDLQKIRFRCCNLVPKVNHFVNRIIQEHRTQLKGQRNDFVDVLLSLQGPDKLSDQDMVAVLWEMIFRGTDTVAVLIEWILARMVLHPDIQSKVHRELDKVVGRSRPLMESDIQSMVYLQAVVKEVLRLHPPGPLLSWARLAITDTTVDGYEVPEGTTAMVNMWAITRDPQVWADPLRFWPERFVCNNENAGGVDMEFSVLGSDLRLAPFGSGRRTCPGKALGLATVSFWVGTLLHEFEWVQSDGDPVDLSEKLRLSCEMANPLSVKVYPRRGC